MRPPITKRQATSCEHAKGGRCRCRCGGRLHGAARVADTATLPITDPHRSDLTDSERRELAAAWVADLCGCTTSAPPPGTAAQLRLFRVAEAPERPAPPPPLHPVALSPVGRYDHRADRAERLRRALRGLSDDLRTRRTGG